MSDRSFGRLDAFTEIAEVISEKGLEAALLYITQELKGAGMSKDDIADEYPGFVTLVARVVLNRELSGQ